MAACAGLALCAKAQGDTSALATWCNELRSVAARREGSLHDRWYVEAAYAWESCVNQGRGDAVLDRLELALRELRRRDVDHWLRLKLETIRVQEYLSGGMCPQERTHLVELARVHSAEGIIREAVSGLLGHGTS